MPRPGGNPGLIKYQFDTDRSEPLVKQMQIRISESMWVDLVEQANWQEFVRQAIAEKLKAGNATS